jgi:hypothetical protein
MAGSELELAGSELELAAAVVEKRRLRPTAAAKRREGSDGIS